MRLTAAMPLIGLLALSACATPREACIRDAAAPWRSAVAERERIAQDLARGYTYETEFQRVERQRWCRSGGGIYPCWTTDTQPMTRRVPVDAEALRARDAVFYDWNPPHGFHDIVGDDEHLVRLVQDEDRGEMVAPAIAAACIEDRADPVRERIGGGNGLGHRLLPAWL